MNDLDLIAAHPVQFKWVVDKRTGGNFGITYPITEKRNVDLSSVSEASL